MTICRIYLLHPYWFGVFVRACDSHDVNMFTSESVYVSDFVYVLVYVYFVRNGMCVIA